MTPNTETLIEIVEKYPILYDTSHPEYKSKMIKGRTWNKIAAKLGNCDGETLRKQWKNLRDAYSKHLRSCNASTGQVSKLTERYRTWPWASLMTFLRPHLRFCETHSNTQGSVEEAGSSQTTTQWNAEELLEFSIYQSTDPNTAHIQTPQIQTPQIQLNTAQLHPNGVSQFEQPHDDTSHDDTPHVHSRRKRSSISQRQSQIDKIIDLMAKKVEKEDDTDLLFKSYAKKLKKMNIRRQATVKFEIAKLMLKAELEEADEMQARSDAERYQENILVKIEQPPATSSAGADTYE